MSSIADHTIHATATVYNATKFAESRRPCVKKTIRFASVWGRPRVSRTVEETYTDQFIACQF